MDRNFGIRLKILLITSVLLSVTLSSCHNSRTSRIIADPNNLSYLYNPSKNAINPRFKVTTYSDNNALLMVKLFSGEMLFSQANESGIPQSLIEISTKLYQTTSGMVLVDTSYSDLRVNINDQLSEYIFEIPLSTEAKNRYVVEIRILDKLRQATHHSYIYFDTQSPYNSYNFTLRGYLDKNDVFVPVLKKDEYFSLSYERTRPDSLFVYYYAPFETVPDPPSLVVPQKIVDYDPQQLIPLPYSDTLALMLPAKGIYKITLGRDIEEGFSIFNLGTEFPLLESAETMIGPLAYLASESELNSLYRAQNQKLALDNFWLSCGGNIEKARELIRIYYNRVLYANYYFTSFTDGWRTERGMIYVMYGPPDILYKTNDGESWGYIKPVVKSRWGNTIRVKEDYIYFNFRKRENLFSDNDYLLSRSETLVTYWDQAVASWRKGIVFRLDNPTEF